MGKDCKEIASSVKISKGFSGTYERKSKTSSNIWSYYDSGEKVHFTIDDTGGGDNEFKTFHITYGPFNAHVWYTKGKRQKSDPENEKYNKNLPSKEYGEWVEWLKKNIDNLDDMAKEFWNELNE